MYAVSVKLSERMLPYHFISEEFIKKRKVWYIDVEEKIYKFR